jgi:uncharacterized DUF497 family protein
MNLFISREVKEKILDKHNVTVEEIHEAFKRRTMKYLREKRAQHHTVPTTLWFISTTKEGRYLKIAFIPYKDKPHLKTAFPIDG